MEKANLHIQKMIDKSMIQMNSHFEQFQKKVNDQQASFKKKIQKQTEKMYDFQTYIKEEFIDFFKSKKRWKDDLQAHLRQVDDKMEVLDRFIGEHDATNQTLTKSSAILCECVNLMTTLYQADVKNRDKLEVEGGFTMSNSLESLEKASPVQAVSLLPKTFTYRSRETEV
jgi:hypothetical protein